MKVPRSIRNNARKRISFLQTQAGEYHLHFAMHAQRLQDVLDLLDGVGAISQAAIISRAIVPMVRYVQYRHKCIGTEPEPEPFLQAGETPTITELTREEKRILAYLANQWPGSLRQAARDLSIPFSTFERRLEQFCRRHRSITDRTITLGQWDFEIGVATPSSSNTTLIIGELHETFPAELLKISALSAGETLKHSFFPGAIE